MAEELTYASAGVNIDEAQRALRGVVDNIRATQGERVVGGIGGFGALFKGLFPEMADPLLVSSIDGVGTKTKVAAMAGDYSNLGKDIVNHCINDILCQGAHPLFFLDYYGCSRLSSATFNQVVNGMAESCAATGCALIGGETAEMPGVYHDEEIDVVGTIVGVVDDALKFPRQVGAGDVVIGLASNGLHTNGFSLARRALFEVGGMSVRDTLPDSEQTLADALLAPHRCYYNAIKPWLGENSPLHGMAHLTGGGFFDNIPRVLSSNTRVMIEKRAWQPLPIFDLIQKTGNINETEMYRTFNMGIGMVLIVDRFYAQNVLNHLNEAGEQAAVIGEVLSGSTDVQLA